MACNSGGTGTHLRFSIAIAYGHEERVTECRCDIPFFDESCGGFPPTRSLPLVFMGGVIELPTSGQLSLSSTGGTGLGGCKLRGLTTKGSSFSGEMAEPLLAERDDATPSRNPEPVLGSRSCDGLDGGGSFAGGTPGDRCVA